MVYLWPIYAHFSVYSLFLFFSDLLQGRIGSQIVPARSALQQPIYIVYTWDDRQHFLISLDVLLKIISSSTFLFSFYTLNVPNTCVCTIVYNIYARNRYFHFKFKTFFIFTNCVFHFSGLYSNMPSIYPMTHVCNLILEMIYEL